MLRQRKIKKTRKDHKCWGCGKLIPAGSSCKYAATVDSEINSGKFTAGHICTNCIADE